MDVYPYSGAWSVVLPVHVDSFSLVVNILSAVANARGMDYEPDLLKSIVTHNEVRAGTR